MRPNADALPHTLPRPEHHRVLAPFQMPKWLSRFPERWDHYRYGPADWERYAALVAWLAGKARQASYTHYETWSESTALGHWADDFDTLMRLHEVTFRAVKASVPDMVVLGGCTHSWTFEYLERFLAAGGAEHCDGLAVHGYTYQPEACVAQFDRLEALLEATRATRPGFGVLLTEIGSRAPAFTLERQAMYFALYTLEVASRDWAHAILWFRFANPRPELQSAYRQTSSHGYAMIGNADRYCRPADAAYRFLDWLLGPCDRVLARGDGANRVYLCHAADGQLRAVAARSREAMQEVVPPQWRRLDYTGAALEDREPGLCFAVHPDHDT